MDEFWCRLTCQPATHLTGQAKLTQIRFRLAGQAIFGAGLGNLVSIILTLFFILELKKQAIGGSNFRQKVSIINFMAGYDRVLCDLEFLFKSFGYL